MKKISHWAKDHVWPARIIIIISTLLLVALGIITGLLLYDIQLTIPALVFIFSILLYVTGVLFYPIRKDRTVRVSYYRQKTCDLLLAGSVFLMLAYLGNHPKQILDQYSAFTAASANSSSLPKDSSLKTYKSLDVFSASMKDKDGKMLKWKERKKMLKEQVRAIRHSKEPSDGAKVALIVLSVLVALGLLYLVAALSCSISCGGSGVLAGFVLVGGVALVVFLLIVVIRKILGKKKKDIRKPKEETGGN
jgi:hypothetical protein